MHLIQALFLWIFVSGLIVGGALAFRRFFPQESPWFGFLLPPLAFVILLNFIEHLVALPNLLLLFPILVGVLAWLITSAKFPRREVLLPALVFLGSFAFTYGIRCLQPDILPTSDGLSDLNKINNYCQGDTLPPIDTWLPPFHYVWYYSLQHYAASVIKRLFDVPLGVAYNVAHALLSALTCTAGAAAAFRLSGGRVWITVAVPFLIESAATGSSAYIQLTGHLAGHDPSLWLANNLSGGVIDPPDHNILWSWLAQDPYRERLELQVPGFWTWRDEYHANASGHFLTLFAVFVVAELFVARRTLWPWLMVIFIPVLAVVSSTWAYPITLLVLAGATILALRAGLRPASLVQGGMLLLGGLILCWPAFYDVTSSPQVPDIMWTPLEQRAPLREFLVQWWPIILLWGCGCFYFRQISPGLRWILIVIPMMLIGVELITVEGRYNTVEKMWGYTYGLGLIALFPFVAQRSRLEELGSVIDRGGLVEVFPFLARRVGIVCRLITILLLLSALISMAGWLKNTFEWAPWSTGIFHLEGNSYLTSDDQRKRMLHVISQVKHRTFLSGKSIWCYNESPSLTVFSGNRSYIAWTYFETVADYGDEADYRNKLNNDFYAGVLSDPLKFLQDNKITGAVIWPGDNIPDTVLAALTKALAPSYEYVDCRGNGGQNAGVFLIRPLPAN
jgi:hypothetical protein